MLVIERWKTFIVHRLEGWGPEELVSVAAELGVAACVVVPLIVAGIVARWAILKNAAPHSVTAAPVGLRSRRIGLDAIRHRS